MYPQTLTMYWIILLLIAPAISTGVIGIFKILFKPDQLVGRQSTSCDPACQSNEQCCASTCILSGQSCCPDGLYYCPLGSVCKPCPSGSTCTDLQGQQDPWTCYPDDASTSSISSGSGKATIVTSIATPGPSTTSPSSAIPTSSYTPPTSIISPSPTTTTQKPPSPTSTTQTPSPSPTPTTQTPLPSPTTSSPPPATTSILSTSPKSITSGTSTQSSTGIVIVTSVNTAKFITSTTSSITHSPIPKWNGTGSLLAGYCATPEFSLVYGAQTTSVFYIGVVGCVGDKTDCCPFQVSSTTTTDTATAAGVGPPTTQFLFPSASAADQSSLPDCPADYETVSSSFCCPSGYLLWDTLLGGITPCYSTTSNYLTPPPILESSTTNIGSSVGPETVTSTVVNVVYAMNYPVKSHPSSLTKGADAGISVGSVAAAALAGSALIYFFLRRRRREHEEGGEHSPYFGRGRSPRDLGSSPSAVPTP